MRDTPYVSVGAFHKAQGFEDRLSQLPEQAGLLFIAVSALPIVGGESTHFEVVLGVSKRLNETMGKMLVVKALDDVMADPKYTISVKVFRGVSGACRDESASRLSPPPAEKNVAS